MNVLPLAAIVTSSVVVASSLVAAGCASKPASLEQKSFSFHVTGDPGKPVAHAALTVSGQVVATTDAQGVALVTLAGHEGDAFDVSVQCPSDFQSPPRPTSVSLHKLAGDKLPEFDASCLPKARTIVLAVNGMKGYRLPVVELGRTIGETDDSGVATILLHVEPSDQFEVTLDTSAPENAMLRPRNPAATFVAKNEDDVFVFNPQLTVLPPPRPTTSRHRPVKVDPMIPIRIQ